MHPAVLHPQSAHTGGGHGEGHGQIQRSRPHHHGDVRWQRPIWRASELVLCMPRACLLIAPFVVVVVVGLPATRLVMFVVCVCVVAQRLGYFFYLFFSAEVRSCVNREVGLGSHSLSHFPHHRRPHPVPNNPYGFCGRKEPWNTIYSAGWVGLFICSCILFSWVFILCDYSFVQLFQSLFG